MEALATVSAQVHQLYRLLNLVLENQKVALPADLVQAGSDLATKTKALQAALDAQASQPKQKE